MTAATDDDSDNAYGSFTGMNGTKDLPVQFVRPSRQRLVFKSNSGTHKKSFVSSRLHRERI